MIKNCFLAESPQKDSIILYCIGNELLFLLSSNRENILCINLALKIARILQLQLNVLIDRKTVG
jgi:hypothetical protein